MPSRNAVQRAFDAYGKARFAEKRAGTWRRTVGEVEQLLNLQKSQYGLRYYLNVELALPTEDAGAYIRGRAERLLSADDADRLPQLLDIEGEEMPDEHREAALLALLERLSPLLDEFASAAALASHERRGTFRSMGITGPARAALARAP